MYLYYVMDVGNRFLEGPYTFKQALQKQKDHWWPTVILKLVVDRDGKEVK